MQRQEPFTLNDPHPMRISKQLADEIGFIESLLLLQIGYLISISSAQEMDGYRWTYQTAHDLHENYFSFISKQTIARKLKNLEDRGYIISANHNKHKYDRTKWYRINDEGIQHLKSISACQGAISHSENCNSHKKKSNSPSETTIPETPTETTTGSKRVYSVALATKNTLSHGTSAFLTPDADAGVASAAPEAVQVYKEMTGMKSIAPSNVDLLTQCVTDIPLFQEAVKKWLAQGYRPGNVTGMIEWYESLVNGKPLPINKPSRAAPSRSGTRRTKRDRNAEHAVQPVAPPTNSLNDYLERISQAVAQQGGHA